MYMHLYVLNEVSIFIGSYNLGVLFFQLSHYSCLRVFLRPEQLALVVSTLPPTERTDPTLSEIIHHHDKDKVGSLKSQNT